MTPHPNTRDALPPIHVGDARVLRLAEIAAEFDADHIARSARSVAERVSEGRFFVACVGQFKRGKSTLLNALVGRAILPAGVVPVTSVPTILRYGAKLSARLRLGAEDWRDIPLNAVEEYVSEEKNPENKKGVVALEIFAPSPLLEDGMCLVDTPGLGSVHLGNTAATQAFIPHIDAAIVVIGADPPLSGEELQLVETVAEEVRDLLFVLNKADRTNESDRATAIRFARQVLEKRLGRAVPEILEVSALDQLEGRAANGDWPKFVQALQFLVQQSGRSLVQEAAERGLRRVADQILAVIHEERDALERPVEDSERRIETLHKTLEQAEQPMREFGYLLTAEQQRLSESLAERRNKFLSSARAAARKELAGCLPGLERRRSGPRYRRDVMHMVQEVARDELAPWLEREAQYAEDAFRKTAQRFVELGNDFLHRLAETGVPGLENLPDELYSEQGLRAESQFHFHPIERIAAPASPFVFVSDFVLGGLGYRGAILGDAEQFLDQLLEVNSSRVQNDVDDRVRESRRQLESDIKSLLRTTTSIAERALAHARMAHAAGSGAVAAALARLDAFAQEIRRSRSSEIPRTPV
ncbi:MAG: dynamin family protein [Candidatus Acidiferrales bacterium]